MPSSCPTPNGPGNPGTWQDEYAPSGDQGVDRGCTWLPGEAAQPPPGPRGRGKVSVWGWDTRASQAVTWNSPPRVTHGDVLSQLKCDQLFSYMSLPVKEVGSPRPHQPRSRKGPQPTASQKPPLRWSALRAPSSSGLATERGRDQPAARGGAWARPAAACAACPLPAAETQARRPS